MGLKVPPAEFELTPDLVTALITDQHSDLSHLTPRTMGEGWDNAIFRLGDSLAVRLPRRAAAAHLIGREQAWLPRLAPQLTLPVPIPFRRGQPGRGYPWDWSIVPWLAGTPAFQAAPTACQAAVLGLFLRSLHTPAPPDAPQNPFRGTSLRQRASGIEERLERLGPSYQDLTPALKVAWGAGLAAPLDTLPTWLHGDLHPQNVLVHEGRIAGIIDWGDITSGDPATDLAGIWMLFPEPAAQSAACSAYGGISDATLRRTKAWAIYFGLMFLESGLNGHLANVALGERILQAVA